MSWKLFRIQTAQNHQPAQKHHSGLGKFFKWKLSCTQSALECSCIRKKYRFHLTASASRCCCKNMVILVTKGFVWCPVLENHLCQKKYKKRGTSLSSMTPVYTYWKFWIFTYFSKTKIYIPVIEFNIFHLGVFSGFFAFHACNIFFLIRVFLQPK